MQQAFEQFIQEKALFTHNNRLLLTVSGGIDSVVLSQLCHDAGYSFAIAHCNFQLRGEESEQDEHFVKSLAQTYQVPFYTTRFQTKKYADENGISTQMAARDLRYNWFENIRTQHQFDFILTAHHQDDVLETILLNLTRGTGLAGLHGILPKNGVIVRPLLFATRKEINAFLTNKQLTWREDSSNTSVDYVRNRLRHDVIPVLRDLNPHVAAAAFQMAERIQEVEKIVAQSIDATSRLLVSTKNDAVWLNKAILENVSSPTEHLNYHLAEYGFSYTQAVLIWQQRNQSVGKQFLSASHQLVNDRLHWLLTPLPSAAPSPILLPADSGEVAFQEGKLQWHKLNSLATISLGYAQSAYLDFNKLTFPLRLRPWGNGDWFCPSGMQGKRKKVSDFLIDSKIPRSLKSKVWVLESANDIVWLVGHRVDERYKATENCLTICAFQFDTTT